MMKSEYDLSSMKSKIILTTSEEGYSVSCLGLPGCWSQGATEEEAIENIGEAIQDYLAAVSTHTLWPVSPKTRG